MAHKLIVTEKAGLLTFVLDRGLPEPIATDVRFENPLSSDDVEDLRWYLEDYLNAPFAVWEDRGKQVEAKLRVFGNSLFNAIFGQGKAGRDAYLKIEDSSSWEFWLSSDNPAFLGLPWELLWDPQAPQPLAFSLAGINRTIPQRKGALKVATSEKLRILMVIARPSGLQDVRYRAVARPLFEKLEVVAGKVEVDVLRPPTFDSLRQSLLAAKNSGQAYQILHFDGHGMFGATQFDGMDPLRFRGPEGVLLFEGKTEHEQIVAAADFGSLIDEAEVPIVVLNACRSGTLGTTAGPEATVAARLMQSGTAAVVAMGFSVYVRAAAEFMATFYETLFQGDSVAHAVARGRQQLRRFQLRPSPRGDLPLQDWCVPVHYGRMEVAFSGLTPPNDSMRQGLPLEAALERLRDKKQQAAEEHATDSLAPIGRFVGRDLAFFSLEQAVGRLPVTLLFGVAGTGKTELAKAFARWLLQTGWAEGSFFYSFDQGLATFGLDGLVTALGIEWFGSDFIGKTKDEMDRRTLMLDVLKRHNLVLVLDNFELVGSIPDPVSTTPPIDYKEAEKFQDFFTAIKHGAKSLVLITSRSDEPWLGAINRMSISGLEDADVLDFADDLLANKPRAQRRRKEKAFGELLSMLDGHPLCLRLLLPLLEEHEAAALIAGLKGGDGPIPASECTDCNHLDSLAASAEYSLQQLAPRDRSMLVALSLFDGIVDADLLAMLSNQDRISTRFDSTSVEEWEGLLKRVSDVGLLSDLGEGCYRLHPFLPAHFLRVWKNESGSKFEEEYQVAQVALIRAAEAFSYGLYDKLQSGQSDYAMQLLWLEHRTLSKLLGSALENEFFDSAARIIRALHEYWIRTGQIVEAEGWRRRVLSKIESETSFLDDKASGRIDFESGRGSLWALIRGFEARQLVQIGNLKEAEQVQLELLDLLEKSKSSDVSQMLGSAYHLQGIIAWRGLELDKAKNWYKRALEAFEKSDDKRSLAMVYYQLGNLASKYEYSVNPEQALIDAKMWHEESLRIKRDLGDFDGVARSYLALGSPP